MRRLAGIACAALITIVTTISTARLEPVALSRAEADQLTGGTLGNCAAMTIDFCPPCVAPTCINISPPLLPGVCIMNPFAAGNSGTSFGGHHVCEGYLGTCDPCTCPWWVEAVCPAFVPPGPGCPAGACINWVFLRGGCDC